MFSAAEAARYIDEAHRTRARYRNLPEAIAPGTLAEAYAARGLLLEIDGTGEPASVQARMEAELATR